ncbi:MAG: peptidylprolyl isomerase [Prevotellaceae bacterium]|jgi:FKBP-type peptidyl-prolyl cis-trans isomerase SlyD|nr:peptidylprolyl isomerase [Prevotellaceae bacterium]
MKVSKNKVVELSYLLTVDGEEVDKATPQAPLSFIVGKGMLLPKFEANLEGKQAGDTFQFMLTAAEGYGEEDENAIMEFPATSFMADGELEENLQEGSVIPMQDNAGHVFQGTVLEVKEDTVVLDFNHPLAGMDLNFEGSVLSVRESTEKELAKGIDGGCSCGCDCDDDGCDCDDKEDGCCCGERC